MRELVGWNARDDVPYRKNPKVVHLKPKEFHEALKARGADAKLLDLRNENESLIGKFCGPRVQTRETCKSSEGF